MGYCEPQLCSALQGDAPLFTALFSTLNQAPISHLFDNSAHYSLVHIVSDKELSAGADLPPITPDLTDAKQQVINKDKQQLLQWSAHSPLAVEQIVVTTGEPAVQLVHQAILSHADLVVIESNGAPYQIPLFESVSDELRKDDSCDLLLLAKAHQVCHQRARFLICLDLDKGCKAILQKAALLAGEADAELHILHVVDLLDGLSVSDQLLNEQEALQATRFDAAREKLDQLLESLPIRPCSVLLKKGQPSHTIASCIDELQIDLLILGLHHPHRYQLMLDRYKPEKLGHHSHHLLLINH